MEKIGNYEYDEEYTTTTLYDAAFRGCVSTLNSLIQIDKLILYKISLTPLTETPLHISALLGHLDFTEALLRENPTMARELDSLKRSPLHLASAEGHTEVVKALLRANCDVCMHLDEDDRTPLHLAVIRGRVEVIRELICARPNSTSVLLDGDSVFHLCVKYNHLEALKLLVNLVDDDHELVRGNKDSNTILHLAVMLKQAKTIQYILSIDRVKESANTLNKMNFTALDALDLGLGHCTDFKSLEIRDILMKANARRARDFNSTLAPQPPPSNDVVSDGTKLSWITKCIQFLEHEQEKTIMGSRGSLMIVATVIATMSFQAAINPPNGVNEDNYGDFFYFYNTIAFISSLSFILLVISGFPLPNNRMGMWLLTLTMCAAVSCIALTYTIAIRISMPPSKKYKNNFLWNIHVTCFETSVGLAGVVFLIFIVRFLFWMVNIFNFFLHKMLQKFRRKEQISPQENIHHVIHIGEMTL